MMSKPISFTIFSTDLLKSVEFYKNIFNFKLEHYYIISHKGIFTSFLKDYPTFSEIQNMDNEDDLLACMSFEDEKEGRKYFNIAYPKHDGCSIEEAIKNIKNPCRKGEINVFIKDIEDIYLNLISKTDKFVKSDIRSYLGKNKLTITIVDDNLYAWNFHVEKSVSWNENLCFRLNQNKKFESISLIDRYKIEENLEWREWSFKIPFIQFPSHWKVAITPPFAGADARFRVNVRPERKDVSVYLDLRDSLGSHGSPYWEVYSTEDNEEPLRFDLNDVDGLINGIEGKNTSDKDNDPYQECKDWLDRYDKGEFVFSVGFEEDDRYKDYQINCQIMMAEILRYFVVKKYPPCRFLQDMLGKKLKEIEKIDIYKLIKNSKVIKYISQNITSNEKMFHDTMFYAIEFYIYGIDTKIKEEIKNKSRILLFNKSGIFG